MIAYAEVVDDDAESRGLYDRSGALSASRSVLNAVSLLECRSLTMSRPAPWSIHMCHPHLRIATLQNIMSNSDKEVLSSNADYE